jgi:hypothetical protein
VLLAEVTALHAAQLLHVRADAQQQAEVHAQRADVGARLALDPEDAEVPRLVVLEQLRERRERQKAERVRECKVR